MKLFALCLSLLIFVLSTKPCADGLASPEPGSVMDERHDGHGHASDLCSPFCSCGMQVVVQLPHEYFRQPLPSHIQAAPGSLYQTVFASRYFGSIWQPPQLS